MVNAARPALERIAAVRLYLIVDATPAHMALADMLESAIDGGVGMIQLREKNLDDAALLRAATLCARVCRQRAVPLIVNDRADIAIAAQADGVHLGQDDMPVEVVRRLLGEKAIVGLSTHSAAQIDAARTSGADYIGVGPIYETPTKPGRPAVGPELVSYAARRAAQPFFAIGGLDPNSVGVVIRAGATRVSVLRFVSRSADPAGAAREMLSAMDRAAAGELGHAR